MTLPEDPCTLAHHGDPCVICGSSGGEWVRGVMEARALFPVVAQKSGTADEVPFSSFVVGQPWDWLAVPRVPWWRRLLRRLAPRFGREPT